MAMEGNLRLRLEFEDSDLLSETQRAEGLNRSWVLVKPRHATISKLAAHLLRKFDLGDYCSDGLVLSMDGFVLPPFESTSILKEDDVIRVEKKQASDLARLPNGRRCLEEEEVEDEPVNGGMKLLANGEFEESDCSEFEESEELEDIKSVLKKTASKKRKASKKLKRSKESKRRKKCDTSEEAPSPKNGKSHKHMLLSGKSLVENGEPSDTYSELKTSCDSESESDELRKNMEISTPNDKRSGQGKEDCKEKGFSSELDASNKVPSRSTRRKKKKRELKREEASLKNKSLKIAELEKTESQKQEVEIVPVVVRPGHIRFEPIDEVDTDQAVHHREISVDTFQWNGITSKKKGQQWGKEKTVTCKRNEKKNLNQESSDVLCTDEETTVKALIDFTKLRPCTSMPQEGDTLAYRLVELSSTVTPELSPFRVGKVSKSDSESKKLTLLQVPEYPIDFEKEKDEYEDEESAAKPDISLYCEDGSLEIEYAFLVDARILKHGNSRAPAPLISYEAMWQDQGSSSLPSRPNSMKQRKGKQPELSTQVTENGKVNSWDDICATLDAKKAELEKVDTWKKTESTAGTSWSYRALRGSALGPTMAILRAQNEL